MSERRRHLLVLLIVLGLIAGSAVVLVTQSTKLGLDLQGGVRLVYQGKPTKQTKVTAESLQRALDIMRDRVDAFGVSEPELNRTGKDQIEVNLPGVENAQRAADQVGSTAQLFFYDWEKNVLDENCKTNATEINGGQTPVTGLYNAVKRASKCEIAVPKNSQAAAGPRFYAFDKVSKKPFNNGLPDESREAVARGPERRGEGARRGARGPAGRARPARREGRARRLRRRIAAGSSATRPGSRAPTSRTRSRTSTSAPATSRSSRSTSPTRARRRSRRSRARSPSAAPTTPTR